MASLRLRRDSGVEVEIDRDRSLVGRDPGSDVVVDDRSVSRRHALVERRGDEWAVVDQGSANGTFVGGRKVAEATLRDGQELRFGSVAFHVVIQEAAAATVLMSVPDLDGATLLMAHPESVLAPVAAPRPLTPPVASSPESRPPPVVLPPPASPPTPVAPRGASSPVSGPPDEALQLLGLDPGASPDQVRARYEELSQDLQVKLAGARTASLKSTYEKNLAALHKAFRRIAHGSEPFGDVADLPSAQPVVGPDLLEGSGVGKRPEPVSVGEAAPAKGSSAILPPATSVLVFAATALMALAAFFFLSSGKIEKTVKKEEEAPELVNARQAAAKYAGAEALLERGALRNGKLRLCNRSSRALEIDWLAVVFLRESDLPASADRELAKRASGFKLGSYNSSFCASDFKVHLPPGAQQAVELRSDDARCRFDGKALFYALSLRRPAAAQPQAAPPGGVRGAGEPSADGPDATLWTSGLLGSRDECVSVGVGW